MTGRDRGVALINALVVVLTIAAIAAALLTRSEAARIRADASQTATQLDLYLDAAERLAADILRPVAESGVVAPGQAWAERRVFPIDRGQVAVAIEDQQGRLNVNWLRTRDGFVDDTFRAVFAQVGVSQRLVAEIEDFLSPSGPRGTAYLNRTPPVWPRGGPAVALEDLRAVDGMRPQDFAALEPVLTALPPESRINLNMAPPAIKPLLLAPLPSERRSEILADSEPIEAIGDIRRRASEILQTESFDALQLDRMTVSSQWFKATLIAELDGQTRRRVVVYQIDPANPESPVVRAARWAVYD